ncbi:MAG: aldo/keto reductase, partial [Novosphingobium sp.]
TYIIVGITFALYIGIAIAARAGSTSEFYVAGKGGNRVLNGMATAAADQSPRRMDSMQLQQLSERNRSIAIALDTIALEIGARPSQVALAWVMSRGVIPVVGATRPEQMRENLEACDLALPDEILARLDQASDFEKGHPYSMTEWDMSVALGYAGMREQIDIAHYPGTRPSRTF